MSFSYNKLRGRIIEKYGTQGKFADALGVTETTISRKMKMNTSFNTSDILEWSELLEIPRDEIGEYFFA